MFVKYRRVFIYHIIRNIDLVWEKYNSGDNKPTFFK